MEPATGDRAEASSETAAADGRGRRRVVLAVAVVLAAGVAVGVVLSTSGGGGTNGASQRDRIAALSGSVGRAWLRFQTPDGSFRLKGSDPGRRAVNPAYLGAALLSMADRSGDPRMRKRFLRAGVAAVDNTVRNADPSSPFPFLAVAVAYRLASANLIESRLVQESLPRWGKWLMEQKQQVAYAGHDCFVDPACYNNWDLVRALAVIETLKANPPGIPPAGSLLADKAATRAWLRKTLNEDVVEALGPQPSTNWSLGRSGVLSDPPLNPPAYHQFSAALISQALADGPSVFSGVGREAAARASHYSKALVAPNGDVALSGRSQLQSWTLASVLLIAAHRVGGRFDATWRAVAGRVLDRLEGHSYRDPSGVFAMTPSARGGGVSGIDPYAIAVDYNGLTLMMLELAAREWQRGRAPGEVPTDRSGLFVDLDGGHLVIGRQPKVWWQWQSESVGTDFRSDAGIIQVKTRVEVKGRDRWIDLLAARPRTLERSVAGPALCGRSRSAPRLPFKVARVVPVVGGAELAGSFEPGPQAGRRQGSPSKIRVVADGDRVTVSWPVRSGQVFCGEMPLVGARVANSRLSGSAAVIRFTPETSVGLARPRPSASSTRTGLHSWRMVVRRDGRATIRISAR